MASFHEIAGFDVVSTLGHGASSAIYKVRDRRGDLYALKHVVKNSPADQRFINQALTEHEIAKRLDNPYLRKSYRLIQHRAVIRVNEVLVLMELIEGRTLEQARPEDIFLLCGICQKVAQGLGAMHEAGYVHSDMKPNNVLLADDQTVKLIDFGQSCRIGTVKERVQGTPDYIAPEQVRRQAITPRTDVFNLGATMYWLLTGQHVPTLIPKGQVGSRKRESQPNASLSTNDGPAPPETMNKQVPTSLSNLVMQCVDPNPRARPETMQAVADRFEIVGAQIVHARQGAEHKQKKSEKAAEAS